MKKNSAVRLLAGCLTVAVLACIYFGLRKGNEEAAGRDTLLGITADRIAGISWVKDGTAWDFTRVSGEWRRVDDPDFPVRQETLNTLAAGVTGVGIYQTMEGVTDLAQYGLDLPAVSFTVTDIDRKTISVAVGRTNETAGSVYAYRREDMTTVYSVLISLSTNFDVTEEDLRDTGGAAAPDDVE